jgi:hypothetical protein
MSAPIRMVALAAMASLAVGACDTRTGPDATGSVTAEANVSAVKFREAGATSLQVARTVIPAAALPRTNETITVFVHLLPDGSKQATWTATGVFTDQGTVESKDFDIRGGPPIFSAGHVFTKGILWSDRGSFVIENRAHYTPAPDSNNTWVAGHGVGFYEGLHGQGTFNVTFATETAPGLVVHTGYVRF